VVIECQIDALHWVTIKQVSHPHQRLILRGLERDVVGADDKGIALRALHLGGLGDQQVDARLQRLFGTPWECGCHPLDAVERGIALYSP